jgi:hypothetical protein
MVTKWVLIDETDGAKCGDGSSLDPATLTRIACACAEQLNQEFAHFYGGQYEVRAGSDSKDIQPGEQVYAFVPTLAQAPGASAYHDTDGKGVPVAYCAVTTCSSLLGPSSVSVDASHELLEAAADPSCNIMADNLAGLLVAYEVGDPVEVQTYASSVDAGVQVSNFVLPSWFDPKAPPPYDFMSEAQIEGAVAPPGPLQIAPGNGGNYIITETSAENETDTFGIQGTQRKARKDTESRFMRRLLGRQISHKGKMKMEEPVRVKITGTLDTSGQPVGEQTQTVMRAHAPPGTIERRERDPRPGSTARTPARPIPVSLQNRTALGGVVPVPQDLAPAVGTPRELSQAGVQAAQRFLSRAEVRSKSGGGPRGQHDPQQAVLQGRKQIRSGPVGISGKKDK